MKKIFFIIALCNFLIVGSVFAASNIVPASKLSQFLNVDLNNDSINDRINWSPTNGGATVTDTNIQGTIWGETMGWINLQPTNGGVTNSCSGTVGGTAWGQNTGWINFAPTNGGVNINTTTGEFSGFAWSQNFGWIKFNCGDGANSCVQTTWNGCASGGGGSGGGGGGTGLDLCSNISGIQTSVPVGYTKTPPELNVTGICLQNQNDVCPNLSGVQTVIPTEYYLDTDDGSCKIDACPNLPGNQATTAQCPGQVTDVCPNIPGNQSVIPNGYIINNQGNCVIPSTTDACPNILGDQTTIPNGYVFDQLGNCIIPPPPVDDVCPNIPGNQGNVPVGYIIDQNGDCVTAPFDACPNVPGIQPVGTICDDSVLQPEGTISSIKILSENTLNIIAPIAGLVGIIGMIPGMEARITNLVLSIPLYRRRRPWGIVYDAETKQPLDPVYVTVYNADNNQVVDTKITDINGRYGFMLPAGNYRMAAQKTHYQFPAQKIQQSHSDGVYNDLYFGEVFSVTNDRQDAVVTLNIPMDRLVTDWNQEEKKRMGMFSWLTRNTKVWSTISLFLFIIGFVFSVYALIVSPGIWNGVVFGLYIIFALLQLIGYGPVTTGKITDQSGKGIPFAVIRVWNAHLKNQVAQRITDAHGNYYLLVTKGDYYLTVDVKNASGGYDRLLTTDTLHVRRGIINKSLTV